MLPNPQPMKGGVTILILPPSTSYHWEKHQSFKTMKAWGQGGRVRALLLPGTYFVIAAPNWYTSWSWKAGSCNRDHYIQREKHTSGIPLCAYTASSHHDFLPSARVCAPHPRQAHLTSDQQSDFSFLAFRFILHCSPQRYPNWAGNSTPATNLLLTTAMSWCSIRRFIRWLRKKIPCWMHSNSYPSSSKACLFSSHTSPPTLSASWDLGHFSDAISL